MSNPQGVTDATDADIAGRITNALIIKGINVRSLSDETGISYPTLRRSLKGGRSFSFREFRSIAAVLDVPPSALLPDAFSNRDAA